MHKTSRLLCVFLCITLLFLSVFVPHTYAMAAQGRITGDSVRLRSETNTSSTVITSLNIGSIVTLNYTVAGAVVDASYGDAWYNVTYGSLTGFVYGKYVQEIAPVYDPDFETNLLNFPASYHDSLRALHNAYPNWRFIADNVGISLDVAIDYEYSAANFTSTRKYVELTYGLEWYDRRVDPNNNDHLIGSSWIYASREAIAFFMDPRNALTVSTAKSSYPNIFTFLQQSYDPTTQDVTGLRSVVSGTFLANGYGGNPDAYINDIMQAAAESGVSPYVIATTIIVEQGTAGTSPIISGTYPGYEGYYNYFNYGASDSNPIVAGLAKAKAEGWNSPNAAIVGGAKKYESGYLSMDQDTYYYMDFNVKYPSKIYHQYATALYDQCTKAARLRATCVANPNATLTFKIPVYSSMPESAYPVLSMENYNPTQPVSTRRKGDYDGDGEITVRELATIRMYLLGVKGLSVEEKSYVDVSGDNDVTVKDLALVRMYLLGLISL